MSKLLRIIVLSALLITVTFSGCSVVEQVLNLPRLEPPECPELFTGIDFEGGRLCVMRDYYSIDGVRQTLNYPQAIEIAQANGWSLPTPSMVDSVWQQADCRLDPITMPPTDAMTSPAYALRHNSLIEEQLFHSDYEDCNIIAGHKKDLVVQQVSGRVTIYGWHRSNGEPIQPVSSVHSADYADYSHGTRFIINGS